MNQLIELKKLINNKNWQKFCAGEDWSDPAFKYVLKDVFNKNASYHRKQWEFVVIFLCLTKSGKLHENSHGASFGAGKEPLIYDLLPFVKSFLATDLYSWNTGWDTAKIGETDTPIEFLHRNAPLKLNLDNLNASEMDMRTLDMKDSSLDFCYSSCAVEHIGHRKDFIQHLQEVKRVLKDDGVYVMTTEFLFNHDTIANKGNYKFDIEYLRELFIEAGLDTISEFDAECEENRLNIPRPYVQPLIGSAKLERILSVAAILDIEGLAYTSCCFVLSPSKRVKPQTFVEYGLKKSSAFIKKKVYNNMMNLYADKRALDPFYSLKKKNRLFLDDHMQFRVVGNQEKSLIQLDQPNFCYTNFIWFANNSIDFVIDVQLNNFAGKLNWLLIEKEQMHIRDRKKIRTMQINYDKDSAVKRIGINFDAQSDKVYALVGQIAIATSNGHKVDISIDTLNITVTLV